MCSHAIALDLHVVQVALVLQIHRSLPGDQQGITQSSKFTLRAGKLMLHTGEYGSIQLTLTPGSPEDPLSPAAPRAPWERKVLSGSVLTKTDIKWCYVGI